MRRTCDCCSQVITAVRPILCPFTTMGQGGQVAGAEPVVDPSHAQLDEPIVGTEAVMWDKDQGAGARAARALPPPKAPSAAAWARHKLTHMPYCAWCPICVAAKRPNHHHRRYKQPERLISFPVADYGYARNTGEDARVCIVVVKVYPLGIFWASVVEGKGMHDDNVVQRLAQLIQQLGLLQVAYRSDQEAALTAMFDAAVRQAGRKAIPITAEQEGKAIELMRQEDLQEEAAASASGSSGPRADIALDAPSAPEPSVPLIAVPELSHPGESASNGAAERAVRSVVEQARCLKLAFAENIGEKVPSSHPVVRWIIDHACYTLNRHLTDDNSGLTPYGKLHGREVNERICEFGERVMYYVPKKLRAKFDVAWRYGWFMGRTAHSDHNLLALYDGTVTRARAMVRLLPAHRWQRSFLGSLRGVPGDEKSLSLEHIEAEPAPHEHASSEYVEEKDDGPLAWKKRFKITSEVLSKYGYSKGCPKCNLHRRGEHERAQKQNHTEKCRARIYNDMRAAGDQRFLAAEALDSDRTRTKSDEPKQSPLKGADQAQHDGAEIPVPQTPQGPVVDDHVEPAKRETHAEPDAPRGQPRTPRPAWADIADDDLLRDGPLPESSPGNDPLPGAEDDADDLDSDAANMNTDEFYQEVNADSEMIENATPWSTALCPNTPRVNRSSMIASLNT